MRVCLVLCIFIVSSKCVKLPSNFKKCNRKQPDLQKCVFEATKYAVSQMYRPYKKLNLPSFLPLEVTEINTNTNRNLIHLNENLKNCKFYGALNINLEKFDFDLKAKTVDAAAVFPLITSFCDYKINGTILNFPMYGEGSSSLNFTNFHFWFHVSYEEKKRRNKTYVEVLKSELDGKPEGLHFQLDNLFNGDEDAGRRMNQIINDNWEALYDDIKPDYINIPNQLLTQIMKGFFSKISLEELFD